MNRVASKVLALVTLCVVTNNVIAADGSKATQPPRLLHALAALSSAVTPLTATPTRKVIVKLTDRSSSVTPTRTKGSALVATTSTGRATGTKTVSKKGRPVWTRDAVVAPVAVPAETQRARGGDYSQAAIDRLIKEIQAGHNLN